MNQSLDYAVVSLHTIAIEPGMNCKLAVTTTTGKELVFLDIQSPKFVTNDDGSKGDENDSITFFVQFGCDLQWLVKKRLSENDMRMVVTDDGKLELRLVPKTEIGRPNPIE